MVHAIDVWRGGQRLDRRQQSRIEVLRREAGLEAGLLDGGRELSVTIPDIRVGDRIEYRYTIHGYNPVFGRGYHDYWSSRFSAPLGVRTVHIDYPMGMSLALVEAELAALDGRFQALVGGAGELVDSSLAGAAEDSTRALQARLQAAEGRRASANCKIRRLRRP